MYLVLLWWSFKNTTGRQQRVSSWGTRILYTSYVRSSENDGDDVNKHKREKNLISYTWDATMYTGRTTRSRYTQQSRPRTRHCSAKHSLIRASAAGVSSSYYTVNVCIYNINCIYITLHVKHDDRNLRGQMRWRRANNRTRVFGTGGFVCACVYMYVCVCVCAYDDGWICTAERGKWHSSARFPMRIILSRGRVESSFFLIYILYAYYRFTIFFTGERPRLHQVGKAAAMVWLCVAQSSPTCRAAAKQAGGWCGGAGVADGKVARLGGVVQLPLSPSTASLSPPPSPPHDRSEDNAPVNGFNARASFSCGRGYIGIRRKSLARLRTG